MNSRHERGGQGPDVSPPPRTVLLVEDNDNDAELLRLMFRRSRVLNPVHVVTSIEDARRYLLGDEPFADRQKFPFPTLLIIDAHLGDGSGFDLLRWLQEHKAQTPIAVVMLTGSDLNAFRTSYDLGAQSFLAKPLKFADFQNMVKHVRGIKLIESSKGHLLEVDSRAITPWY